MAERGGRDSCSVHILPILKISLLPQVQLPCDALKVSGPLLLFSSSPEMKLSLLKAYLTPKPVRGPLRMFACHPLAGYLLDWGRVGVGLGEERCLGGGP